MVDIYPSTQVSVYIGLAYMYIFHSPHLRVQDKYILYIYKVCIYHYSPQQTFWAAICTWFAGEECRGLSVSLWYAQIRVSGPLFKHLGPGVLERPPHPSATKGEEMEERALAAAAAAQKPMNTWVCARAEVNAEVIISTTPILYPQWFNQLQRKKEERQEFIVLFLFILPLFKKSRLCYERRNERIDGYQ